MVIVIFSIYGACISFLFETMRTLCETTLYKKDENDRCLFCEEFEHTMNGRQDIQTYLHESQQSFLHPSDDAVLSSDEAASSVLDYVCAYGHLPDSDACEQDSKITSIPTQGRKHKLISSCSRTDPLCSIHENYLENDIFETLKRAVLTHPRYDRI